MLKGKKILLGITGSIAAYKSALLVRLLVKEGAEVKVIMTRAANDFIAPLTMSTLSKNPVATELFDEAGWENHVLLGRWADLFVIAPASCNTLAKMATGLCDNLLLAVYLSATCPVWVAPAMDEDMWIHPATQKNLTALQGFGHRILPVEDGELASGLTGKGRMSEPEFIREQIMGFFENTGTLSGKRVLITAGPTRENIDPVRYMSNRSSGKMGIALAVECMNRGAEVTMVAGPVTAILPKVHKLVNVISAKEMHDAAMAEFSDVDIAIMCAAVADYTPESISVEKMKKTDALELKLKATPDILRAAGERKKAGQILVGFALETENGYANAIKKLQEKKADFIILNTLTDAGAGFGTDTNKITIFEACGGVYPFEMKSKAAVAADIITTIIQPKHA